MVWWILVLTTKPVTEMHVVVTVVVIVSVSVLLSLLTHRVVVLKVFM